MKIVCDLQELRVLGALMFACETLQINHEIKYALYKLEPQQFLNQGRGLIYQEIKKRILNNEPCTYQDLQNVFMGKVGLIEIIKSIPIEVSYKMLEKDIEVIIKHYYAFKANLRAIEAVKSYQEGKDIAEVIKQQEDAFMDALSNKNYSSPIRAKLFKNTLDDFCQGKLKNANTITTTCDTVNTLFGHKLQAGTLVTIAGASGKGKSRFALYLADKINQALDNKYILYFDYEMDELTNMNRIILQEIGVTNIDSHTVSQHYNKLKDKRLLYLNGNDTEKAIDEIITISHVENRDYPLGVIICDYIGCLEDNNKKYKDYSRVLRDHADKLASLAKKLNCVVIATTQVQRDNVPSKQQKTDRSNPYNVPFAANISYSKGLEEKSSYILGIGKMADETFSDELCVITRKNRFIQKYPEVYFKDKNGRYEPMSYDFEPSAYKCLMNNEYDDAI